MSDRSPADDLAYRDWDMERPCDRHFVHLVPAVKWDFFTTRLRPLADDCAIAVRDVRLLTLVRRLLPAIALFSFAGMFAIDVIAREIHTRKYYTQSFGYSFLALGFAAFVLWAYLQNERGTPLDRFLRQGWLRSFGKYSYGIYVYHLSFLIAGGFLFARVSIHGMRVIPSVPYCVGIVAASFIVARLSYAIFEKRFLNMKKRFEPVPLTERAQDDFTGPGIIRE